MNNKNEINRVIAKFMGDSDAVPVNLHELSERQLKIYLKYTRSLDALVPAWEKLGLFPGFDSFESYRGRRVYQCWFNGKTMDIITDTETTIQLAAATATYKAILELKKEGE